MLSEATCALRVCLLFAACRWPSSTNVRNNLFWHSAKGAKVCIFNVFIVIVAVVVRLYQQESRVLLDQTPRNVRWIIDKKFSAFSSSSSHLLFTSLHIRCVTRLCASTYVRFEYLLLSSLEIYSLRFFFSLYFPRPFSLWRRLQYVCRVPSATSSFAIFTWYFAVEMYVYEKLRLGNSYECVFFHRSRHKRCDLILRDNTEKYTHTE